MSDEQCQALSDVLNTAPDGVGAKKRKLDMGNSENTDTGKSPSSVQISGCCGITINYCKLNAHPVYISGCYSGGMVTVT